MPSNAASDVLGRSRTRSFGFLEYEGNSWACYLVTRRTSQRRWCGHLTFRPERADRVAEVRTADLFIEAEEAEIERRARSLGRPLLTGLLASALEVESRPSGARLRGWVREALAHERGRAPADDSTLRAEYLTYRLDQLTHLVMLIDETAFEGVVTRLLEKESYSFRASDRLQFAMLFSQKLEALLPLPPFEAFVADFTQHEAGYRRYHHDLHAGAESGAP